MKFNRKGLLINGGCYESADLFLREISRLAGRQIFCSLVVGSSQRDMESSSSGLISPFCSPLAASDANSTRPSPADSSRHIATPGSRRCVATPTSPKKKKRRSCHCSTRSSLQHRALPPLRAGLQHRRASCGRLRPPLHRGRGALQQCRLRPPLYAPLQPATQLRRRPLQHPNHHAASLQPSQ